MACFAALLIPALIEALGTASTAVAVGVAASQVVNLIDQQHGEQAHERLITPVHRGYAEALTASALALDGLIIAGARRPASYGPARQQLQDMSQFLLAECIVGQPLRPFATSYSMHGAALQNTLPPAVTDTEANPHIMNHDLILQSVHRVMANMLELSNSLIVD